MYEEGARTEGYWQRSPGGLSQGINFHKTVVHRFLSIYETTVFCIFIHYRLRFYIIKGGNMERSVMKKLLLSLVRPRTAVTIMPNRKSLIFQGER